MNKKKHDKVDLERKRGMFLQLGIVISSLLVLALLEWKTPINEASVVYKVDDIELETDLLPIERKPELKPPMPRKYNKLNIIPDNSEITENFEILSPEIEPYEAVPISQIKLPEEDDQEVPTVWIAPTMPKFPGGKIGLQQYISKHLKYPVEAIQKGLQGKVFVKFIVSSNGEIKKVSLVNSVHPLLDKEALRVVKSLPKWEAGTQNGQKVNVWITIPIVFQL